MVSVIIACYNDHYWLSRTVAALYEGHNTTSFEVIVVDDCSDIPISEVLYMPVRILRNRVHQGVGYCFDRGVNEAVGDTIVLMGSDVLVRDRSWLLEADLTAKTYPNTIGAAVSYCFSPENQDFEDENIKKTYGADIRWIMEGWKKYIKLDGDYSDYVLDIVNAASINDEGVVKKWNYTVPCLIGAFYVTTKEFYQKIHGWDTDGGLNKGHQHWGGLEPWISIKAWMAGGEVRVIPNLHVGHIYGRLTHAGGVMAQRGVRADLRWYNKLFIVHTLFTEYERQGILKMVERLYKENTAYDKNYGIAKKLIQQNKKWVETVMRRNDELAIGERGYRSLDLFKHKFKQTLPWEV